MSCQEHWNIPLNSIGSEPFYGRDKNKNDFGVEKFDVLGSNFNSSSEEDPMDIDPNFILPFNFGIVNNEGDWFISKNNEEVWCSIPLAGYRG